MTITRAQNSPVVESVTTGLPPQFSSTDAHALTRYAADYWPVARRSTLAVRSGLFRRPDDGLIDANDSGFVTRV